MSTGAWTAFKAVRVVVFALATVLSVSWTVMLMILLIREWNSYSISQRTTVTISLAINGVSSIIFYLMIVVRFRLWLDAARVVSILLLQLGSIISFGVFSSSLPCNNLGSESDCRQVTIGIINGGWALTGLLLFYTFYLVAMSSVPLPPPPPNPEATLLESHEPDSRPLSINSQTWLLNEKRRSKTSVHSHGSFIPPLLSKPSILQSPRNSIRSLSISSRQQYGIYRPDTPASFRPTAPSSMSSVRGNKETTFFRPRTPVYPTSQTLPNPFMDPVSRESSPLAEWLPAIQYPGSTYYPAALPQLLPSPYGSQMIPAPPYMNSGLLAQPRVGLGLSVPLLSSYLAAPGTSMALRPSVVPNMPPREYMTSPGLGSVHSEVASIYSSRSGSRSVSPAALGRSLGLPASP